MVIMIIMKDIDNNNNKITPFFSPSTFSGNNNSNIIPTAIQRCRDIYQHHIFGTTTPLTLYGILLSVYQYAMLLQEQQQH
eukprot:UN10457